MLKLELTCTVNYKTTFCYLIFQRNYSDWILLELVVFHQFYLMFVNCELNTGLKESEGMFPETVFKMSPRIAEKGFSEHRRLLLKIRTGNFPFIHFWASNLTKCYFWLVCAKFLLFWVVSHILRYFSEAELMQTNKQTTLQG